MPAAQGFELYCKKRGGVVNRVKCAPVDVVKTARAVMSKGKADEVEVRYQDRYMFTIDPPLLDKKI